MTGHGHVHDVAAGGLRPGLVRRTGWTMLAGCPAGTETDTQIGYGIDLRSAGELVADPVDRFPAEVLHLPVDAADAAAHLAGTPGAPAYTALGLVTLAGCGPAIAEVVATVLDRAPEPVVLGCSLGKDRTGIVVAVLLALAGAGDEAISANDRAARAALVACRPAVAAYAARRGVAPAELVRRCSIGDAPVLALLRALRTEHGGPRAYLRRHGVPARLLDTAPRVLAG